MAVRALELRPGDIILKSLPCYSCSIIESESESSFSHSGLLIKNEQDELVVAEALGKVRTQTIEDFLDQSAQNKQIVVVRSIELAQIYQRSKQQFKKISDTLTNLFYTHYNQLPFDSRYLWDNFSESGQELLYCSEMITKLLNRVLTKKIRPTPMSFDRNWQYWYEYFDGDVPQGKLGNSPSDFVNPELFFRLN